MAQRKLTPLQKEAYGHYRNKFISDNYKTYLLRFNYGKDADVITYLEQVKEQGGNVTGLIRKMVREKIDQEKEQAGEKTPDKQENQADEM